MGLDLTKFIRATSTRRQKARNNFFCLGTQRRIFWPTAKLLMASVVEPFPPQNNFFSTIFFLFHVWNFKSKKTIPPLTKNTRQDPPWPPPPTQQPTGLDRSAEHFTPDAPVPQWTRSHYMLYISFTWKHKPEKIQKTKDSKKQQWRSCWCNFPTNSVVD